MSSSEDSADAIVVGAGLAGLAATAELADAGRRVILVDQEPEAGMGGQAYWSFGGIFLVDSPEQRRMRIRDSRELAWQDWLGTAGFDRPEDVWPRRWAEAYVDFAAGEKRAWMRSHGIRFLPNPGWAERGGYTATGHGNSVPRFHVTWGTGPGVVEPSGVARGQESSRTAVGEFSLRAPAVIVTSGGIGGNHELVRRNWPQRLGEPPRRMVSGVPAHVDGRMLGIATDAGANVINPDRMWHYVEGLKNWNPIWPNHGIRILPGPSPLWLDARGRRLPVPLFPGFDTLGTLEHIMGSGHEHTWFVVTQKIIEREFALSGSEQNPDITSKSLRRVLGARVLGGAPGPVEAFKRHGEDFVVERCLPDLVHGMNAVTGGEPLLKLEQVEHEVVARDRELANPYTKDLQVTAIHGARRYLPDRVTRVAAPHRLLDPEVR